MLKPKCPPEGMEWQELNITVDSGACDHVLGPKEVSPQEVQVTDAVRRGVTYTTASGHPLPNLGEVRMMGTTAEGQELNLTMQAAGIKKPLASVRKMCRAGNRVVFEELSESQGGYVENKQSGARIPIVKQDGTYRVSVWRLRKRDSGNMFSALEGDLDDLSDEEVEGANSSSSTGFQGHA